MILKIRKFGATLVLMLDFARKTSMIMTILLAAVFVFVSAPNAQANSKYAAIVLDMDTGKVLHSSRADKKLYPASLTKMMTLYMAFEAIEDGRLSLDQHLPISRTASRQPPSKIGLRAGQTITVRDAIQACATKSANDAAVVLAEAIGGSVSNFAAMATARAHSLGMSRTTFKNPHGLTQRGQLSTARDMGLLGRRLFLDFPDHYHVFKRKVFRHSGRKYRATNKLLGKYRGADGIKTGYTSASGFNLVASAEQDGRRILGVVFGGRSSARRNRHMRKLLDDGFKIAPKRAVATTLPPVDYYLESPLPRLSPKRGGWKGTSVAIAAVASERQKSVVGKGLAALSSVIVAPAEASEANGNYAVQIGAYRKRSLAERRLRDVKRLSQPANLRKAAPVVSVRNAGGRPLYRARLAGFAKRDADNACQRLKANRVDCFVVIDN